MGVLLQVNVGHGDTSLPRTQPGFATNPPTPTPASTPIPTPTPTPIRLNRTNATLPNTAKSLEVYCKGTNLSTLAPPPTNPT